MTTKPLKLDSELQAFLREVHAGQSLALAAWAATVLQAGTATMADLEKCFELGFGS